MNAVLVLDFESIFNCDLWSKVLASLIMQYMHLNPSFRLVSALATWTIPKYSKYAC